MKDYLTAILAGLIAFALISLVVLILLAVYGAVTDELTMQYRTERNEWGQDKSLPRPCILDC